MLRINAGLLLSGLVAATSASAACGPDAADIKGERGQYRFTAELADDAEERNHGLMFRNQLGKFSSMLFVYETPVDAVFWMRNTEIPLDMLFFDQSGTLKSIVANAEPHTDTPRPGGPGIRYVLEINGGLAATLGIEPGALLRHPAMDQTLAAWTCAG
jgi:hypothetical protein